MGPWSNGEYERRAGEGIQAGAHRPGLSVAGAGGRGRLLPRGAPRPRLYSAAASHLDAVAAERTADGSAPADAGTLVVVDPCRGAARAPARRAAERRAARYGARLVREQLQRGADRRGAGVLVRALSAAPGFAAQRRHLPPLRRARRAARLIVLRRRPGEADRLRRGRLLDAGAHALRLQRARPADDRAAHPDLGDLASRTSARRAAAALRRDCGGVHRRARHQPGGLRPAAVRRQHRAGAVLRAAAVPAVGRGASRHYRHRERARCHGGGYDLGRGARPRAVRRRRAAGHGARHAAFPDRGFRAALAARGGARGARPGGARGERAAPAAHASLPGGDARRALGRHRARAEPAADRDPQQRAGGAALHRRQRRARQGGAGRDPERHHRRQPARRRR